MSATCCPCVTLFTAELRIFCAAAAGKVTQASAPVHRGAISIDRSAVTIHGQTAVNSNEYFPATYLFVIHNAGLTAPSIERTSTPSVRIDPSVNTPTAVPSVVPGSLSHHALQPFCELT